MNKINNKSINSGIYNDNFSNKNNESTEMNVSEVKAQSIFQRIKAKCFTIINLLCFSIFVKKVAVKENKDFQSVEVKDNKKFAEVENKIDSDKKNEKVEEEKGNNETKKVETLVKTNSSSIINFLFCGCFSKKKDV